MRSRNKSEHLVLRRHSRAFTLIEMLIIAPIIIIFIGVMIVMITSITGSSLQAREQNTMAYQVQDALDLIENEGARSGTYPATTGTLTSPQGSGNSTTAFTVASNDTSSTDNDTLIIKTPATTTNPTNSSKSLIYYNTPNACTSADVSKNDYYPVTTVYFVSGGSLWQRTILPSTGTPCSTPWQRPSCAESQSLTGVCKAYDNKLVSDVTSFSVQYLKADGSALTADKASTAKSVNVTITTSKSVAGRTLTYTGSTRSVALNGGSAASSGSVTFDYTGAIKTWTVPEGVTSLTIIAKGAQGGYGTSTYVGGLGASMQGTFTVAAGDILKILVGQQGGNSESYKAGGGGGGSFVTTNANSPLIIAGGGGGGGGNSSPSNGSPGLTTTAGGSSPSYSGGTNGSGGAAGTGSSGGGGLTGNGTNSGYSGPGMSFTSGGAGGAGGTCTAGGGAGGFGGGSGGEWCQQGASGAGGGYSGGAGVNSTGVGGGGGSYNGGTNQTNASGTQSGNGQVKITYSSDGSAGSGGGGVGGNVATFDYTGSAQTWTVPAGVTLLQIECWGAEGSRYTTSANGGKGGYAKGQLTVTPSQTLYIYVGGKPADYSSTAGFNGGGYGSGDNGNSTGGTGGGGASDIRTTTSLTSRLIVGGGGGGGYSGGTTFGLGGDGGGTSGVSGGGYGGGGSSAGGGGTQTGSATASGYGGSAGTLGVGGSGGTYGGGGGGGYYGGGGGMGGGGGSSYIGGVTGGTTTAGLRIGNGQVKITY